MGCSGSNPFHETFSLDVFSDRQYVITLKGGICKYKYNLYTNTTVDKYNLWANTNTAASYTNKKTLRLSCKRKLYIHSYYGHNHLNYYKSTILMGFHLFQNYQKLFLERCYYLVMLKLCYLLFVCTPKPHPYSHFTKFCI